MGFRSQTEANAPQRCGDADGGGHEGVRSYVGRNIESAPVSYEPQTAL